MKKLLHTLFFFLLVTQICFAQGSWTQIGDMPEIRYAHGLNEINGKIYITGGINTENSPFPTTVLVFDSSSGVWSTIPLFNNESRAMHVSCVVDGNLYVIGGIHVLYSIMSSMDMYNPGTGDWTRIDDSLSIPVLLAACATIDDTIYVIGGMPDFSYVGSKKVQAYNTISGEWTLKADMPSGRWGCSATVFNGKIYVFGGYSAPPYSSVEVYDPQTDTWDTTTVFTPMPTARYCLTSCLLESNIFVIGGWYSSGGGPIYDKVEVYNPESDVWYTETPMPVACAVLASIVRNGKIYLYGGSCVTHPLIGTSDIYEFTPPPVPVELTSFTATANGKVITLSWSTATELNNLGFEIQRSIDGEKFFTVGFVNGYGTTTEPQNYSYADRNLDYGKYSYRLKQVDYDGIFEYSDVIDVDFRAFNSYLLEQNFPNPFNPTTTIGIGLQNKSNVKITVLNSIGEEVAVVLNEEKEPGFYQVEFNATNLPSGVYFYQLKAGDFVETKKMLLLK